MTAARHFWQTRPSANKLGDAPWVHGKLQPMIERPQPLETKRAPWWQRLAGRV